MYLLICDHTSMASAITNNTLKHRFETEASHKTAFLNYRISGSEITFTHTEVPASIGGRGIGTALVKAGLDYAREHQLRVIPACPFVADFLQAHPQYQSLAG